MPLLYNPNILRQSHLQPQQFQPPRLNYYHGLRLIAEGGTARVYWGVDRRSGYPVAIKELRTRHITNPTVRDNFRVMETQLYLYANHPNIPHLVDFIDNGQQMFIVMDYIDGISLEQYIYHVCGLMPEDRALPIFLKVLDTIGCLHRLYIPHLNIFDGVLHLDIKSNNVMVLPDGQIKIIDLGIASRMSNTTNSGYGTPAYMPPEQSGRGVCGKYTDIFALGIMLFEMLTSRLPFSGHTVEEVRNRIANDPTPQMKQFYPRLSDELQSIVERALQKNPANRYQSCQEFANDIVTYMQRHGIRPW
ncbi:MAG: serine/threonine protein kinase [Bacteroidales bacterium]|nr:serine/threonine protein kinase [Bacteroidales bacterium]